MSAFPHGSHHCFLAPTYLAELSEYSPFSPVYNSEAFKLWGREHFSYLKAVCYPPTKTVLCLVPGVALVVPFFFCTSRAFCVDLSESPEHGDNPDRCVMPLPVLYPSAPPPPQGNVSLSVARPLCVLSALQCKLQRTDANSGLRKEGKKCKGVGVASGRPRGKS